MVKVNIHKSRSEVSLVEQPTIGCLPTAYLKFMIKFKKKLYIFNLYFMQLFSANATILTTKSS